MIKRYCDVRGCKNESWKEQIDVCCGWLQSTKDSNKTEEFQPFEKPNLIKKDLCEKHFKIWCKATYEAFYGEVKNHKV
jgi:hypothetical protein